MPDQDQTAILQGRVEQAMQGGQPLQIRGGGSKSFYGNHSEGEALEMAGHRGIVNYQPRELVITARSGTSLAEVEAVLAEQGQVLPFEPPRFSDNATIGGCVAAGLSGPARAYAGSVRDFVLGVRMINGRAEALRFGGEVMKNVAGYDVSRLMTGSLGTLGIILDASFKVLPKPAAEATLMLEQPLQAAIAMMNRLPAQNHPVNATFYLDGQLYIRLAGTESAVSAARSQLGGEIIEDVSFWTDLRDQRHAFFQQRLPLWRLSLPVTSVTAGLGDDLAVEWGGAQRWLYSDQPAQQIRQQVADVGGHATLFRGGSPDTEKFHPLNEVAMTLHTRLKQSFDPQRLFNPGRMYREL